MIPLISASISHRGGRDENQDMCGSLMLDAGACFVVADGLGGHRGGEAAARCAVESILDSFAAQPDFSQETLVRLVAEANTAILKKQKEGPQESGMRTTAVVLLSDYSAALWAHIGDSRLYHFREGRNIFCTKDHSVPQLLVDAGEITSDQIRGHEDRNRLLKTLGNEEAQSPTIFYEPIAVQQGDVFLLCTDGFWELVPEKVMENKLAQASSPAKWLLGMEESLLMHATGKYDNYTALAVSVGIRQGKCNRLLRAYQRLAGIFAKKTA